MQACMWSGQEVYKSVQSPEVYKLVQQNVYKINMCKLYTPRVTSSNILA